MTQDSLLKLEELFLEMIEAGVQAPSGDNSQPWHFVMDETSLKVYNEPHKDLPFFNFEGSGTFVAHGALIENMRIVANSLGYEAEIKKFPDPDNRRLTATIKLRKTREVCDADLRECIFSRVTNRKEYEPEDIKEFICDEMIEAAEARGARLVILKDDTLKKDLAKALALSEKVMLENKTMHNQFFGHIVWTEQEERRKRTGLYLKTIELPILVQQFFKLCRHWPLMKFLSFIQVPRLVAMGNARLYAQSTLAAIVVKDSDPASFVLAGEAMQRVWLRGVPRGLAMQPVAGMLFLGRRVEANEGDIFNKKELQVVRSAYAKIRLALGLQPGEVPAMILRMGVPTDPASARSSRLEPVIYFGADVDKF